MNSRALIGGLAAYFYNGFAGKIPSRMFDGRKFHIRTGDDVSIGPEAAILTLGHDPQSPICKLICAEIKTLFARSTHMDAAKFSLS